MPGFTQSLVRLVFACPNSYPNPHMVILRGRCFRTKCSPLIARSARTQRLSSLMVYPPPPTLPYMVTWLTRNCLILARTLQ